MATVLGAMVLLLAMPKSKRAGEVGASQSETAGVATFREALDNRKVLLALPIFLVGALRYTVLNVLMQYAFLRCGRPVSKTALLYTEIAVVSIV